MINEDHFKSLLDIDFSKINHEVKSPDECPECEGQGTTKWAFGRKCCSTCSGMGVVRKDTVNRTSIFDK